MNGPIIGTYLRAVERLNRQARAAEAERDYAMEMVVSLRLDIADAEREAAGWKRRAEALYDACDPEIRDGVVGCITTIEGLPEVAG